ALLSIEEAQQVFRIHRLWKESNIDVTVGEIAVSQGLLTLNERDTILARLKERQAERSSVDPIPFQSRLARTQLSIRGGPLLDILVVAVMVITWLSGGDWVTIGTS